MAVIDKKTQFSWISGVLVLILSNTVCAVTVYKTVDANGVVAFSDTPPVNKAGVEVLELNVSAANEDPGAKLRLKQMRETTDRMVADRRQREQHRAKMRQLKRDAVHREAVANTQAEPYPLLIPGYRSYRAPARIQRRLFQHRDFRQSSNQRVIPYRNQQLMRPLVSRYKN